MLTEKGKTTAAGHGRDRAQVKLTGEIRQLVYTAMCEPLATGGTLAYPLCLIVSYVRKSLL